MARKKKESKKPEVSTKDRKDITKFLIRELNKGHDEKIAFSLNEPNPTEVRSYISTGSSVLDTLIANTTGYCGIPCGKITEIVGEEASGKSLLATHILAECQRRGGIAVYLDTEYAASPDFMERLGIDRDKLVYMNPGSIEECYMAIEKTIVMARAVNTKNEVCIVWDSIAATPPQAELEGDYDPNSRIGLAAKAHAKGLRKITKTVGNDRVTIVLTNQLKVKIGVMFGDPMGTPGGKAIPYHASVRIRLTKSKALDNGEAKDLKEVEGFRTLAKVFKNRLGPPMRKCEFNIMFESGIDDLSSIRDTLWIRGIITKSAGYMKMIGPDNEDLKFRAAAWSKMMKEEKFSKYVHELLDKLLVITYETDDIIDAEIDVESVLEMESLAMDFEDV